MKISKTPWRIFKLTSSGGEALILNADGDPIAGPIFFLSDAREIVRLVNAAACYRRKVPRKTKKGAAR